MGYIGGIVSGSFARQVGYEITTVGHVTPLFDSCTAALLIPMQVAALAVETVLGGALAAAVTGCVVLFKLRADWVRPALLIASIVAFGAAAVNGVQSWGDWQIDRPCF